MKENQDNRNTYSSEFREQALRKVYERGDRTIAQVADEMNVKLHTLKNWIKAQRRERPMNDTMQARRPNGRSPAERLELLLLSHGLEDEGLQAFCRSRGIFPRKRDKPGQPPISAERSDPNQNPRLSIRQPGPHPAI